MYIDPPESILLLISKEHRDFVYWNKIIEEQNNGLESIQFGSDVYEQINAVVTMNVRRADYINATISNATIIGNDNGDTTKTLMKNYP